MILFLCCSVWLWLGDGYFIVTWTIPDAKGDNPFKVHEMEVSDPSRG